VETLGFIVQGFGVALQPLNLFYTFIGVLLGTVIGVLPGIGPSAAIALLIPVTYGMSPASALIMLAGIYYGAQYGGSTTSILINTPGEASSVMTCLDGYQMARKGRAGAALAASAWGSFIAGTLSVVGLTLLSVPLANFALRFGPPEFFLIMLFAMTAVSSLTGKSPAKAMISTVGGLMIATVGVDLQSGQSRFTMGIIFLEDGVGFLLIAVGLFAISEVLHMMGQMFEGTVEIIRIQGALQMNREEWRRAIVPMLRGSSSACCPGRAGSSPPSSRTSPRSACRSTRRSSAMAPSRVWRVRKRPTTPALVAPWCPCWRWASQGPQPRQCCWGP
jgi:putative tricarboxylic transport membrane protein